MNKITRFFTKRRVMRNLEALVFTLEFERDMMGAELERIMRQAEGLRRRIDLNKKALTDRESLRADSGMTDEDLEKKAAGLEATVAKDQEDLKSLEMEKVQKGMQYKQVSAAYASEASKVMLLARY